MIYMVISLIRGVCVFVSDKTERVLLDCNCHPRQRWGVEFPLQNHIPANKHRPLELTLPLVCYHLLNKHRKLGKNTFRNRTEWIHSVCRVYNNPTFADLKTSIYLQPPGTEAADVRGIVAVWTI